LIVRENQTMDLAPGTYWVTGDLTVASTGILHCSACDNVAGSGVTIVLTGSVDIAGGIVSLNAPSSGPFAGVVLAQDLGGMEPSRGSKITGGPAATINGLIYFPKSSVTFHGNPSMTGPKCLILVVNWLNIDADSTLDSAGCRIIGLTTLPTIATVTLAG
jgi:hypothetical protein